MTKGFGLWQRHQSIFVEWCVDPSQVWGLGLVLAALVHHGWESDEQHECRKSRN